MARVGRLAGAILAETGGRYYLVGHPKEPCDYAAAGFEPPTEDIDAQARRWIPLVSRAGTDVVLAPPVLRLDVEGEALPRALAGRLLIERNASVSERLWRLVVTAASGDAGGEGPPAPGASAPSLAPVEVDARWLGAVPASVWRVVQDTVLRCT